MSDYFRDEAKRLANECAYWKAQARMYCNDLDVVVTKLEVAEESSANWQALYQQERGSTVKAAEALDDLALTLLTTSDENPEGNKLTAAVVKKCAAIVREVAL